MFGVPAGLCSNDSPPFPHAITEKKQPLKKKIAKKTDLVKLLPFRQSENNSIIANMYRFLSLSHVKGPLDPCTVRPS